MKTSIIRRLNEAAPILAALSLICLVMWPALSGGFIFDDYPIFADNKAIKISGWEYQAWMGVLAWAHENIQRPLAMLSYALNYAFGAGPRGFKGTNLAIHLFNTVLLAAFATRLLRTGWPARSDGYNPVQAQHPKRWALLLATTWALHPLQISSVMYVVQRMELLGFSFVLLALLAYWHARQRQIAGQRSWPWTLTCGVLAIAGYYAKETAVLTAGYALLLELTVLRFEARASLTRRAWKVFYTVGCAMAILLFLFYLLPHYATATDFSGRDYTAWERTLTQLRALSMYIGWCVLPLPSQLHFYYDNYLVSTGWLHPTSTLIAGLFLLALTTLAAAIRKRRPLLALGIGWFFMAHALTSSPIALELVFEHRNYPALFGILLSITDIIWLATRHTHPRLPALLATIFIASLSFLTLLRASTWGSSLQLAVTLAAENPSSPRAAYDLATRYMLMSEGDPASPMYARTVAELERAASLAKSSPLPEQALLLMAAGGGVPLKQAWWDSYLHKLQTRPIGPQEFNALNGLATKRVNENVATIDDKQLQRAFEIMIKRQPTRSTWRVQFADLASLTLHDEALAIKQLLVALELEKSTPDYGIQLASYLVSNDRDVEALAVIDRAQSMQPTLRSNIQLLELRTKAERARRQPNLEAPNP